MTEPTSPPKPSMGLQVLGLALILLGGAVIFAGQLEPLAGGVLTSAVGGGLIGLGVWLNLRGRRPKP